MLLPKLSFVRFLPAAAIALGTGNLAGEAIHAVATGVAIDAPWGFATAAYIIWAYVAYTAIGQTEAWKEKFFWAVDNIDYVGDIAAPETLIKVR